MSALRTRFQNITSASKSAASSSGGSVGLCRFEIELGSCKDYESLSEHHYRARRPATVTRVLRAVQTRDTAAARFSGSAATKRTIGVLVESLPALQCVLRDKALARRHGAIADIRQRARLLNSEVRCISRVVVHPQFRGVGVAVALVRAALESATTTYTEALAAMGHVNPFFERAGMTAYQRPRHELDERLATALARVGVSVVDLALLDGTLARIDALPADTRLWLQRELMDWYRRTVGRSDYRTADLRQVLGAARGRLTCEPVYYLAMQEQAI
jgi:GNAT superfamily N-acetyltransferase